MTKQSVRQLVDIFMKSDGFMSLRKSNSEDLTIKYSYLFSFAHKVLSEAHTLHLKQKFDPDQTMNNYLAQQNQALHQSNYIALSDNGSSDEEENFNSSVEDGEDGVVHDFKE